jgi:hypothetical protein
MKEADFVVEPAPEETKPAEKPAVKPTEAPKKQ